MALFSFLHFRINNRNLFICKAVLGLLCCFNLSYADTNISQDSLNNKANAYLEQVNLKENTANENEALYRLALPLYEQTNDWDNYTHVLNMLSVVYYTNQNYSSFFKNANLALKIAKNKLLPKNKNYHIALHNWVATEATKGNYQKAIELFGEYVDLIDANKTKKIERAPYYQNMGSFFRELGDYDEAIRYLEKALSIRLEHNAPKDMDKIALLTEIAQIHKLKGESKIAIEHYHKAMRMADALNIKSDYLDQIYLYCFQDLADLYLNKNDITHAKKWIDKAINLQKNKPFIKVHESFLALAKYWLLKGNHSKAIATFQEALRLTKQINIDKNQHSTTAKVLVELSDTYLYLQNFDSTRTVLYNAMEINGINNEMSKLYTLPDSLRWIDSSIAYRTMNKIVELIKADPIISTERNRLLYQLQYFDQIHLVIHEIRLDLKTKEAKLSLMEEAKSLYEDAIFICHQLYQKTQDSKYIDKAFHFSEASRAILLLESRQQQRALAASQIPDSLLQQERNIHQTLTFYHNQQALLIKNAKENWESQNKIFNQEIFELKEEQKAFNRMLESNHPNYHQLRDITPLVSMSETQTHLLDANSAIVSYFIGQAHSFAFLITESDRKLIHWESNAQDEDLISDLMKQISEEPISSSFEADLQSFCKTSNTLYNKYWKNLDDLIPEQISQITVLPDGMLNYLPFEVLIDKLPENKLKSYSTNATEYLLKKYQLSYNYSASLTSFSIKNNSNENMSFLGVAPSFESSSSTDLLACDNSTLYALGCSEKEVVNIQSLFEGTTLLGAQANKQAFLDNASKHSILHLATHACLDSDNPLLNRIYFNDGFLTALDLQVLNLNADLIVLSACNTGTGELKKGEGVISLARSLSYAGCPSSLVSLWSIDDCASSKISNKYYQQLKEGESKDNALRASKLNYLENTSDKLQAHPYYWAGLIQTGETRPLVFNNNNMVWTFGATAFFLLSFFAARKFSN